MPEDKVERRALLDVSNQNGLLLQQGMKKSSAAASLIVKQNEEPQKKKAAVNLAPLLDNFELEVSKDIRYICEYARTIHDNYLMVESKHMPSPSYMNNQTDITARMRAILVDWLVEVHQKFKMQPQTLYICVNVMDRYLERKAVKRDELQLIGCTALWTASKIEEIYSPEVQDFVQISDRAFKRADLIAMEGQILNVLDFKLTFPTPFVFLTRWLRVSNADKRQKLFATYCVERSLQEYTFLRYKPSMVAASAVMLAFQVVPSASFVEWTALLEKHTSYKAEDLSECVREMRAMVAEAEHRTLLSVRKKYNTEENVFVARIPVSKE